MPLEVRENPRRRHRRVLKGCGLGTQVAYNVHNNSVVNALRAVRERVFAVEGPNGLLPTPKPKPGLIKQKLSGFSAAVTAEVGHCTPWTKQQFVASYRGSKRLRYERAVSSLRSREVEKRDALMRSFVKAEAVNFTAKPDPAPRIIQPRDPRYNVCVGRYLRPIEHRVYKAIGKVCGGPTVMKGYNAVETGTHLRKMWQSYLSPCAIMLDASRFDQHVSADALRWEHRFYDSLYHSGELRRLLGWQITNEGVVVCPDGGFRYRVTGCRMSGDMNTALGNCLFMCAMVYTYAQEKGVDVRLANNGDDCAVFMERKDRGRFEAGLQQWFLDLGVNIKVEGVATRFEHVEFCQTRPVFDGEQWRMCRNPHTALSKDVMWKTPDFQSPELSYRKWLHAVGTAGAALADGMPIFSAAYTAFKRNGVPAKRVQGFGNMESGFEYMAKGLVQRRSHVDDSARVSFWHAWGIPPNMQEAVEEHYNSFTLVSGLWPMMSAVDHSGIRLVDHRE